jgi:hypothetical protein
MPGYGCEGILGKFGVKGTLLGGGAEEEVGSGDGEEEVGGPGGEDCREGVDVAEGFEDEGDYPVGDGEADGCAYAGEGALFAHREGEGDREDRHDQGDERVGDFFVELDAEALGVEAGLLEVGDVG